MKIPSESILKAIIGKYLTEIFTVKYCHVQCITGLDTQKHTVVAVVEILSKKAKKSRRIITCRYEINDYGIISIIAHNVGKEERL